MGQNVKRKNLNENITRIPLENLIEYSINGSGKKVGRHLKNRIYISYQNKF